MQHSMSKQILNFLCSWQKQKVIKFCHLTPVKYSLMDHAINWRRRIDADFFNMFYNTNKKYHCCIRCQNRYQTFCINGKKNKTQNAWIEFFGQNWRRGQFLYYILRRKQKKESQPLQRNTSPIYTHLTPVKDWYIMRWALSYNHFASPHLRKR